MKKYKTRIRLALTQLLIAAVVVQSVLGTASAVTTPGPLPNGPVQIPTGNISLLSLAVKGAKINDARLVQWRTGAAFVGPDLPNETRGGLIFQKFFGQPSGSVDLTASPIRDNTANTANGLLAVWSDDAIRLDFQKPNDIGLAVTIYTDNDDLNNKTDPLYGVQLRGGPVGGADLGNTTTPYRTSVLPLIWKAVSLQDLSAVTRLNVNSAATGIMPSTSPVFMAAEIPDTACPTPSVANSCSIACAAQGPYAAGTRSSAGFCDFSTHFIVDKNNNVHLNNPTANLYLLNTWFEAIPKGVNATLDAQRLAVFNYVSAIGPFGANTTDNGQGLGQFNPAYLLVGLEMTNALRTVYSTTIWLEVKTY